MTTNDHPAFYFLYKGQKYPVTVKTPDTPIYCPGFLKANLYRALKANFSTSDHIDELIVFTDSDYLTWKLIEPDEIIDHPNSTITFSCEHEPFKDAFAMYNVFDTIPLNLETMVNQFFNNKLINQTEGGVGIEKVVALFLNNSNSYISEVGVGYVMDYFEIISEYEKDQRITDLVDELKNDSRYCIQIDKTHFIVGVGYCESLVNDAEFIEFHFVDDTIKFLKFVSIDNQKK